MQSDVDRLVRAAEGLEGTWRSRPPPPVPEVAIVAHHGNDVVPLLMALLSDDPHAERDRKRWATPDLFTAREIQRGVTTTDGSGTRVERRCRCRCSDG